MDDSTPNHLEILSLLTTDQDSRERNVPFPQLRNYLHYKQDINLSPNRLFNAPTFFLHLGNRVINTTHSQEFTPSLPQFFQFSNLSMRLKKTTAEVRGFDEKSVEYVIHKFDVKPYRLGALCERDKIDWKEHQIEVNENGELFDCIAKRNVKVLLDGEPIDDHLKIKKIRISNRSTPEVLILFDHFMASGVIELGEEPICNLKEIPGTYETVDFQCDTNFRAILRKVELSERPPREDVISIQFYQNRLRSLAAKIEITEHLAERSTVHHEHNALLLAICPYFSSFFRVFHCYSQGETQKYLPENRGWSAREKLVYLSYRLENEVACKEIYQKWEDNDFQTRCEKDKECLYVRRLIRLGAFLSEPKNDTAMPKEVLAEFLFQISSALSALWSILTKQDHGKERMLGETYKMLVSFPHLYLSTPENILQTLPFLPDNDMRRIFLEVVLAKASEPIFNEALGLYTDYPEVMLKGLMKHPNFVLFGVDKIRLPPGLLERFAYWMVDPNRSSKTPRVFLPPAPGKKTSTPEEGSPSNTDTDPSSPASEELPGSSTAPPKEPEYIDLSDDEEPPPRAQSVLREEHVVEDTDSDDDIEVTYQSYAPFVQRAPRRVIMDNEVIVVHVQAPVAPAPQGPVEEVLFPHPEPILEQQDAPIVENEGNVLVEQEDALRDAPIAERVEEVLMEHQDAPIAEQDVLFEHQDDPIVERVEEVLFEHPDAPIPEQDVLLEHQDAPIAEPDGNRLLEQQDALIAEQDVLLEQPAALPAPEQSRAPHPAEQDDNELSEQQNSHSSKPPLSEQPPTSPAPPEPSSEQPDAPRSPEPTTSSLEQLDAPGPSSAPSSSRNLFGRPLRTPEPLPEDAPEDAPEDVADVKPQIKLIPVRKRKLNLLDLCMSPMRSLSPEPRRPRLPPAPEVATPTSHRCRRGKIAASPNLLKHVFGKK